MQVLGDRGTEQRDDRGGDGGERGQVIEAEPDACPAGADGGAAGGEVFARGTEGSGPWRGEGPQGGGVLPSEGRGDAGGVGEQRVPALAGGLLAGEQEQAGWVGQAGPVCVRDQLGVGERAVAGAG